MAIEVPVHLFIYPAAITTATQGLLWADPALPVEGPDPNPKVHLCSPLTGSQGYSSSPQQLWLMGIFLIQQLFVTNTAIKQVGFACWSNLHKKLPINC